MVWVALALLPASLLLLRKAGGEGRRVRAVWVFATGGLLMMLAGRAAAAAGGRPDWILEIARAFVEIAALHFTAVLLFRVLLKRLELPRIASDLATAAGYVVVLIGMLSRVGVNVTGLIATSAVLTAMIGFALQDLLGNLAGGLTLQWERGIRIGDWIRSDPYIGRVVSLRFRHTAIETPDGDTLLLPNSLLTRTAVTLLGRAEAETAAASPGFLKHRRLLTFPLKYKHTPTQVVEAVEAALAASPIEGIAVQPRPRCIIVEYQTTHVLYGVLVWIMRPAVELLDLSAVRARIYFALERVGAPLVAVPHPVQFQSQALEANGAPAALDAVLRVSVLEPLTEEERLTLAAMLQECRFAPGERILTQGEEGDSLYILERGTASVILSDETQHTREVATLGPGDFFGEMSLLTGEKRSATVEARQEVDCFRLSKGDFRQVLERRPELAEEISRILLERRSALALAKSALESSQGSNSGGGHRDLVKRIRSFFGL